MLGVQTGSPQSVVARCRSEEESFDNRDYFKEMISYPMAVLYPSKGLNGCRKRMKAFCLSHVGLNLILTF